MDGAAAIPAPTAPRYGWGQAFAALIGGSFIALPVLFVPAILLGFVHLEVFTTHYPETPGRGWPWRVDGTWALLADLGPLVLVATVVAWSIGLVVDRRCARWPIGACALAVGWLPLAGDQRSGVLAVSGAVAFAAMWFTTRAAATMPRRRLPLPRAAKIALVPIVVVGLSAVSLSYGALHPLAASTADDPDRVTLRGGATDRFGLVLRNDGPLAARVRAIALGPGAEPVIPRLRVARVERQGPRHEAPTVDGLYSPAGMPRIDAGETRILWLTLAGPVRCLGRVIVPAIDVRIELAGVRRVQRVRLAHALRVVCRPARR